MTKMLHIYHDYTVQHALLRVQSITDPEIIYTLNPGQRISIRQRVAGEKYRIFSITIGKPNQPRYVIANLVDVEVGVDTQNNNLVVNNSWDQTIKRSIYYTNHNMADIPYEDRRKPVIPNWENLSMQERRRQCKIRGHSWDPFRPNDPLQCYERSRVGL